MNDDTLDQIKHIKIKRKDAPENKEKKEKKTSRIGKSGRRVKEKERKKLTRKQKVILTLSIIGSIILICGIIFGVYVYKAGGDVAQAVLNVASDVVGDKDPIFVLILGISEDISNALTDK